MTTRVFIIFTILFVSFSGSIFGQQTKDRSFKVQSLLPHGNVGLGYEYGFLPFLINATPPKGNFKTDGTFGIQLKTLPFSGSFYYSSLGTISGLNNHFTVRFDAQEFQRQMEEKLKANELKRIQSIDSLGKVRQKLKTKLDYLYLIQDKKIQLPIDSSKYNFPNLPSKDLPEGRLAFDSLDLSLPDLGYDSIGNLDMDTSLAEVHKPDFDMDQYMDSISGLVNSTQQKVKQIEGTINELKSLNALSKDSLMDLEMDKAGTPWMKKVNHIMSGVKRFDVGLTYPNYSQFLIARIPIRGVNLEYQKDKLFFAFTHGKTVNNILLTNNVVQNNLNAARNLYNFFDFNNIEDGRRVTAAKVGIGAKDATHIHVGALYGLGKVSYRDSSLVVDSERNLAVEIDGGVKLKKAHYFGVQFGRSAVQVNNVNLGEQGTLLDQLLDFNDRTNALLANYKLTLKSSELSLTYRWVDPYFRSFGVGFLRSDNIRYELKYKQKLGNKLQASVYFRRENDNLLGLYSYQNVLMSYGVGLSYRPDKHWMFKADVRPIALDATNSIDSLAYVNNNLIINGIVNYNNRIGGKTYLNCAAIYSYYQLTLDEGLQVYQNLNLNLSLEGQQITDMLIFNHYRTTDINSVPLASLVQNDLTYRFKKVSATATLKGSFTQSQKFDFGYGAKIMYQISKLFSLSLSGDKLVVGDFYNSIYNEGLLSYPYRFFGGVNIRW